VRGRYGCRAATAAVSPVGHSAKVVQNETASETFAEEFCVVIAFSHLFSSFFDLTDIGIHFRRQ
tara:strand:- start:668214 stop:668405 length:192 start_codon:yes stop_codon:yes gene_type:complete